MSISFMIGEARKGGPKPKAAAAAADAPTTPTAQLARALAQYDATVDPSVADALTRLAHVIAAGDALAAAARAVLETNSPRKADHGRS